MKRLLLTTLPGAFLVAALVWANAGQTGLAQVQKGKKRAAETKYLMRGVVQTHCGGIAALLKKDAVDEKAWDTLACHASVLNELSYVLMDDGRCPDKTWASAAQTLRECSAKVLSAAQAKNADDAREAFKGLTAACASCHGAHKSKSK
jgi:hypothetical protein